MKSQHATGDHTLVRGGAHSAATRLTSDGRGRSHIALVGFMGAGKSTVGRALADALGVEFLDLDAVIAQTAGKSITEIFREHGEVGFRARERAALREVLATTTPLVIATGGGTFVDPAMRACVQEVARTVFLQASAETIFARVSQGEGRSQRPLLAGPDPMDTLARLLEERTPAYEQCDVTVQTDALAVPAIVAAIADQLHLVVGGASGARTATATGRYNAATSQPPAAAAEIEFAETGRGRIEVQTATGSYPIEFAATGGTWVTEAVARACPGERVAVITDSNVAELHADAVVAQLRAAQKVVTLQTLPAGETSKNLRTVEGLYEALLDAQLTRSDALIALGGGVVGDITGFVAATLLRGIRYVQMPTTTLAAVDSSVGGKTGVNLGRGKNLVGCFYPPRAVLLVGAHLATQSRRNHAAGLVEALKMAATFDVELFRSMEQHAQELLDFALPLVLRTVAQAVSIKAGVVMRDEHENGERAALNFGHTLGHAIETGEHYELLHGEAVALGMVGECEWAASCGYAPASIGERVARALGSLGVATDWRARAVDVAALGVDKKRHGSQVRLPVVAALGSYDFRWVAAAALVDFVSRRKAS